MEKKDVLKDYLISRLISQNKIVDGYGKLYYQVNEDLIDTCLDVDFYDKDVLAVLYSGDQVLTSRFLEAKNVDAFDNNRLTLYYFYLRLWTIKYRDSLYPNVFEGNTWLARLLRKVEPQNNNELCALLFFKKHLEGNTRLDNLFYQIDAQPQGKTLYTSAEELQDCLSPNLDFFHVDLFSPLKAKKAYDIILMSNILDWAKNDPTRLENAKDNLVRLLNDDGTIICSSLVRNDENSFSQEREIFSDDFEFNGGIQGYTYTRKKH